MQALRFLLFSAVASVSFASTPQFSTYLGGAGGEFASAVTTDRQGNIYVAGQTSSPDFPVTPNAAQTKFGGESDVFIAKLSPDGVLIWCTFFGGGRGDGARGIGVDQEGNVIVAGMTGSLDLPTANAVSSSLDNGHLRYGADAFLVKLDPTGSRFLYATYLGGDGQEWAWAMTVDRAGNAYVTGDTGPTDFFPGPDGPLTQKTNSTLTFLVKVAPDGRIVYTKFLESLSPRGVAVDGEGAAYLTGFGGGFYSLGSAQAMVVKMAPSGKEVVYQTAIGGSSFDIASAIALDAAGAAYITGMTSSADFPMVRPIQRSFGARPLWRTTDSAGSWAPLDGVPFGVLVALVADAGTLYAGAGDGGVFVSRDAGVTWVPANNGLTDTRITALVKDPSAPGVFYAAVAGGVFKTTDSAGFWSPTGKLPFAIRLLAADPSIPGTLYAASLLGEIAKTTDGGGTWTAGATISISCGNCVESLAVDPNTGNVFVTALLVTRFCIFCIGPPPPLLPSLYRSTDGGATFRGVSNVTGRAPNLMIDASARPSTIYAGLVARSSDGGENWTAIQGPVQTTVSSVTLDPSTGALYAAVSSPDVKLYVSFDRGTTWRTANPPFSGAQGRVPAINGLVADPASPGTLYVLTGSSSTAFVAKLSPDGGTLLFSTFLGGHPSFDSDQSAGGGSVYANLYVVPGDSYGEGIALDGDGNIVVAGGTRSRDFPVVNAFQAANADYLDAWVAVMAADGSGLIESTYLGGGGSDNPRALSVDATGSVVVAGETYSDNFPLRNAWQPERKGYADAFVTKLRWR